MSFVVTLLWLAIVGLVALWVIGFFFAHLGAVVWIALVLAVILLVWNLLWRGRAET